MLSISLASVSQIRTNISARFEAPIQPLAYGNEGRFEMTLMHGDMYYGIKGIFSNSYSGTSYAWVGQEIAPKLIFGIGYGNKSFRAVEGTNVPPSLGRGIVGICNVSLFKDQLQIHSVVFPTERRFGYDIQMSMPLGRNFPNVTAGLRFKDHAAYPFIEWDKKFKSIPVTIGTLVSWNGVSLVVKL